MATDAALGEKRSGTGPLPAVVSDMVILVVSFKCTIKTDDVDAVTLLRIALGFFYIADNILAR